MVKHNLSLETLNCKCCRGGARRVPVLDYHICTREFGLIPRVLGPLVERRTRYKRLKKELKVSDPAAAQIFEERCTMLKWVLVTSFGYTGYKNARFGKIECHEAINAFAREIMLETMRIAELSGFEVLHGIIDSIWLKPRRGACAPEEVVRRIEDAIGIQISLEGTYRWIVFLPNKDSKVGALNRYYGLFEDGEFKIRGIELRKHDTPPFFREVQTEILRLLSAARDGEAFLRMMPEVDVLARRHKARLKAGQVARVDLVYSRSVSKSIEEYRQFNHQLACLKQLREHGVEPAAGETVRFVVTNAGSKDWHARVRAAELLEKDTPYDAGFYCREVDRMVSTMLDFARVAPSAVG
jgi:DNA polymerase elongation subunit (family B)